MEHSSDDKVIRLNWFKVSKHLSAVKHKMFDVEN